MLAAGTPDQSSVELLLSEAFHGDRGPRLCQEFVDAARRAPQGRQAPSAWSGTVGEAVAQINELATVADRPSPEVRLLTELIRDAPTLPRYERPQYWRTRHTRPTLESTMTLAEVKTAWAGEVAQLARVGYFADAFGNSCLDAEDDPDARGQRQLSEDLDTVVPLWPLTHGGKPTRMEQTWPDDVFYDVIEALHDVAARPRQRYWHRHCDDWHYTDFAKTAGQAVYRWKVNALLARSAVSLQLANSGMDVGRLVHASGDDRDRLVRDVLSVESDRDERAHAVELFRARTAGAPEKRSAIVSLAGLLEKRKALLQESLLSKDEDALFMVANKFNLRHRRADQHTDYTEAYLDWIYWWYLATLELTDQLLARQASTP